MLVGSLAVILLLCLMCRRSSSSCLSYAARTSGTVSTRTWTMYLDRKVFAAHRVSLPLSGCKHHPNVCGTLLGPAGPLGRVAAAVCEGGGAGRGGSPLLLPRSGQSPLTVHLPHAVLAVSVALSAFQLIISWRRVVCVPIVARRLCWCVFA